MVSFTTRLADFASGFRWDVLPPAVQARARATALDSLGAILAGSSSAYDSSSILCSVLAGQGDAPLATVVGRGVRIAPINAAFANAAFGYCCEVDNLHPGAIMHGGSMVLPSALAVAESRRLPGADLLAALVLGIDVACRVSLALGPRALYARGFQPTSIAGGFGVAAAAGNLMRLDGGHMANAFGLAATQSAGLMAWTSDPTGHSKSLNTGIAARAGLTAALLAEAGFGGPQEVLDPTAEYNVFRAWADASDPDALVEGLHERYFATELAFKLYSCCAFLQPALDGLLSLLDSGRITADRVEGITLRFARSGAAIIDNSPLRTHSAQYILPVGLLRRRVTLDDILSDASEDPRVAALSQRVRVVPDDDLDRVYPDRYASVVEVSLRGGETASERVDYAQGHPRNPASVEQLEEKFLGLAGGVVGTPNARRLIDLVNRLDQLDDLGELMAILGGTGAGSG